ncbi:MAG: hypothetical protein ACOC7R_00525 [Planctomycetota bacterium]
MKRFGRQLRCEKADGFGQMVTVVSEALDVNRTDARHLVLVLASCGLVNFEEEQAAEMVDRKERLISAAAPAVEAPSCKGVWRIGPSV